MDFSSITTSSWLSAAGTMVIGLIVSVAVSRTVRTVARPLRLQEDVARIVSRVLRAAVFVLAVIIALDQLGVEVGPLIGALGIGGVLVAMSLQPVLGNLVGSVMLHARRPIRQGDQIWSNGQGGTVVDINGRAVVLKSFDGEIIYLPNLKVLEEALVNQTRDDYRRTLIPFLVAYNTDLRSAQQLLTKALRSMPELEDAPPADVLVTGFGESGVQMVARVWHPSEELTSQWTVSEAAITIRETLAEAGITIPFPQRVLRFDGRPAGSNPPGQDPSGERTDRNGSPTRSQSGDDTDLDSAFGPSDAY